MTPKKMIQKIVGKLEKFASIGASSVFHVTKKVRYFHREFITIGSGVTIASNCSIECFPYRDKDKKSKPKLVISDNVGIQPFTYIQCAGSIFIGENTMIAQNVYITDYNHFLKPDERGYQNPFLTIEPVVIGKGAWIGHGAIILSGVNVGSFSVIGAGSVVTNSIPDYCLAVGNPAKVIKRWDKTTEKWIPVQK